MAASGRMVEWEAPELARRRADHDRAEAIYGALKLDFRLRRGAAGAGHAYALALIRYGWLDDAGHLLAQMAARARLYPDEGFAPLCVAHALAELGLAWLERVPEGHSRHAAACRERAHQVAEHLADLVFGLPGQRDLPPHLCGLGTALAEAYQAAGEGETAASVMAAVMILPMEGIRAA